MALGNITVSAINFNNEPFVRSLTATIIPETGYVVAGTEPVAWSFTAPVWARTKFGYSYVPGTTGFYTELSTMVFYVSAETHDYRISQYTLFEQIIAASYLTPGPVVESTDSYTLVYDSFPNITPPTIYSNFENTNYSNLFYREVTNQYNFTLSAIANYSLLNPTNYLLSSEYFNTWTKKAFLSASPSTELAPNVKSTATLLLPITSTITDTISSITNISNTLSTTPHTPGIYTVGPTNYTTVGQGKNAIFEIGVTSTSAVSSIDIINGGQNFQPGDIITVYNTVFNINTEIFPVIFEVNTVKNNPHEISQTIPLEADTYTYSVFAYPLTGRFLYLRGFNQGDVIFDISQGLTYSNGSWNNSNVSFVDVQLYDPSLPIFNTLGTGFNNTVRAAVISGDRIIVGGDFTSYNGLSANRIACLSADGSLIKTFNASGSGFNNSVHAISLIPNSSNFYVGGDFTQYSAASAERIIRLDYNGTRVASFDTASGFNSTVRTIAVSSTNLFVGGSFTAHKKVTNNYIICLRGESGAANTSFVITGTNGFNNAVYSIAVDTTQSRIYVGGSFTAFKTTTTKVDRIACLNTIGNLVTTFTQTTSGFEGGVRSVSIDSLGRILVGGRFFTYDKTKQRGVVRLLNTGKVDTTFNTAEGFEYELDSTTRPTIYSVVEDLSTQNIYVGGLFSVFNRQTNNQGIIRLTSSGAKDTDFNNSGTFSDSTPTSFLQTIVLSGDNLFAGGSYISYKGRSVGSFTALNNRGYIPVYTDARFQNWRRCTATFTLTSAGNYEASLGITTNTTSISSSVEGNESILIWGGQINRGSIGALTPYISTLNVPQTQRYNETWITYNNLTTRAGNIPLTSTKFAQLCSFKTSTPVICSINLTVSAATTFDSIKPWYTPHVITNSLTGVFVTRMLTADFTGFPTSYFDTFGRQVTGLDFVTETYTTSPGLCFYGEGHTETIKLSAKNDPNIQQYYWVIGNNDTGYYNISTQSYNNGLFAIAVSSSIGSYPTYPIQLIVSDNLILSSGPFYYFDDSTGKQIPYPFYYSTVDLSGNSNVTNTRFKESIRVVSFDVPATAFDPGISAVNIFLPGNDLPKLFNAYLRVSLSGFKSDVLDTCYDKYNLVWRWSTFTGCTANPTNFSSLPSTWSTMQCLYSAGALPSMTGTPVTADPGPFPKTWKPQGSTTLSAERSPVFCYGSNIVWTLSTQQWVVNQANPGNLTEYTYPLQYLENGTLPNTVSNSKNTPFSIKGEQTITCSISSPPFDWGLKEIVVGDSYNTVILSRGNFKIYTSNKYVLTGTEVKFENISEGFNKVTNVNIDLGNNTTLILTGDNIYKNFTAIYNTVGPKTITVTTNYETSASISPTIDVFADIVEVLPYYDVVDLENFLTERTPLTLPYPEKPYIAPNEWAVEDNINSVFKKIYANLDYLESRSNIYQYTPTEYFGWLGSIPVNVTEEEKCSLWVWEDLDCLTNGQEISWEDTEAISSDFPTITTTGPYASCGSWQQHECNVDLLNPDCYGKYGIQWKWKSRKAASSTKLITWKSTKSDNAYAKKWKYESWVTQDGDTIIGTPCLIGEWHVNIPKLSAYQEPIPRCESVNRCIYTDVVSKNNILFVSNKTEIKVLSSNYTPTFISSLQLIDDLTAFRNIRSIALDSNNKLFVLDSLLNKVASYNVDITQPIPFELSLSWGGFGTSKSNFKFSKPNDLHIDNADNIWVTDTGNRCIKQYSNTGSWIQTITSSIFENFEPISLCTDSTNQLHVLTNNGIHVFNNTGNYIFTYYITEQTSQTPLKITTNYNKEIIYVITNTQVLKYFKNGIFFNYLINNKDCVTDIVDVFQDEFRNIFIASGDKIVKYVDIMTLKNIKGPLPETYWSLNDILIHKEEYIQNWVYNRSFQRMWDNIEMFRRSLIFDNSSICKTYVPPVHDKEKIIIGQNEIVTSTVINRNINYLWDNFLTLMNYFNPDCETAIEERSLREIEAAQIINITQN